MVVEPGLAEVVLGLGAGGLLPDLLDARYLEQGLIKVHGEEVPADLGVSADDERHRDLSPWRSDDVSEPVNGVDGNERWRRRVALDFRLDVPHDGGA